MSLIITDNSIKLLIYYLKQIVKKIIYVDNIFDE